MTESVADNLARVNARIAEAAKAAGRSPEEITLIAVSKEKPAEAVAEALRAGQRIFGENRVQEALAKIEAVPREAEWHLIGHLQSNKARMIPNRFAAVHTLDSERLAHALNRHAEAAGIVLDVFLQLNLAAEPTKSGVKTLAELGPLLEAALGCGALRLRGLMTLPDPTLSEGETRRHFGEVRELQNKVRAEFGLGPAFSELSMGMSHDFEWAIAEGATMVRVGTAIFGARP
jgi:pyridoxal phosphate enzyme (YggS family)